MKRHERGFTIIEVIIVMGIIGVVMSVIVQFFSRVNRDYQVQQQLSDVTQNAEVAAALLRHDLRSAGYPGSAAEAALAGVSNLGREGYLKRASEWIFTPTSSPSSTASVVPAVDTMKMSSVNMNTLVLRRSTSSCNNATNGCDILVITRLVPEAPAVTGGFRAEQVTYTAKNDPTSGTMRLMRLTQRFNCDNTSACTADTTFNNANTQMAAVEGVEEFQVYFVNNSAAAQPGLFTGPAVSSLTTPQNSSRAVGVYLRVRSPRPDTSVVDTRTYPTIALPGSVTPGSLEIPSVTYSGAARHYRRVEKLMTVSFLNPQSVK